MNSFATIAGAVVEVLHHGWLDPGPYATAWRTLMSFIGEPGPW
jgi:hypothetical protein